MQIATRQLILGPHQMRGDTSNGAIPAFLAGRSMYWIGMLNGEIQPIGAEHLVGEMGGLWAHPLKVAQGVSFHLHASDGTALPESPAHVTEALSHLRWNYTVGPLAAERRDFIVEDRAVFCSLLSLHNATNTPFSGELRVSAVLTFVGCWFGNLAAGGGVYWLDGNTMRGHDRTYAEQWGIAWGSSDTPTHATFEPHPMGACATMYYRLQLAPGETVVLEHMLAADHQRGHHGAADVLASVQGNGTALLASKEDGYHTVASGGVQITTPDNELNRGMALAKVNLHMLSADYAPGLPPYFLAGVPEYPQLFGCDTEYTVPGALTAGFGAQTRSALLALAAYGERGCGRIPHEITTNGRVFHPGNTQETPQFAQACWDYVRWTGDLTFLREIYPLCREGVSEYVPALWGGHATYPMGDGVVERHGMGSRKLDSACYMFQAFTAMAEMAAALDNQADTTYYRQQASALAAAFDADWWLEDEQLYADSLHTDGRPQLDGHWTVMLPLQVGLAPAEHARAAFQRIASEYVNEWGLVHTRTEDERVWTLPTGLLALAACDQSDSALAVRMLRNIARTTEHGMLGAFKELIPIGLCFVQLWSAGLYIQGLLEGIAGVSPLAHQHRVIIAPRLPSDWERIDVNELHVGDHRLQIELLRGSVTIAHLAGPCDLHVEYRPDGAASPVSSLLAAGQRVTLQPEPAV